MIQTVVKKVTENDNEIIGQAADIIKLGGLVAFPTETVYGLGADALNADAVTKIYEAKGRPSDNPLIVHIACLQEIQKLVSFIPLAAERLIDAYFPGPLTLIFQKKDIIPKKTSGGLETVSIRMPQNKIAQKLIKMSGCPIAAPSANSSGKPSPTRASHVEFDLFGKIDMILDGGASELGIESTIVDVTEKTPILLRPGSITIEMLRDIVDIKIDKAVITDCDLSGTPKSPGMKYAHYSPRANVTIVLGDKENVIKTIKKLAEESVHHGKKTGIMSTVQSKQFYDINKNYVVLTVGNIDSPETIAAGLFKTLRKFDYLGVSEVFAEGFDETGIGFSIMNRLKKSAGYSIIKV